MSYRNHNNMNIFSQVSCKFYSPLFCSQDLQVKLSKLMHVPNLSSQVPEMDETYAEDSFVVGSEEEEVESSEEEAEDIELVPEDSYVDGRRQYATRRRVLLHKARTGAKTRPEAPPEQRAGVKTKRSRVIRINDSSEEETEQVDKERRHLTGGGVAVPLHPKVVQPEPSSFQQQQQKASYSSSCTIASKVSLLSKAQKSSVTEKQLNER